MVATIEGEFARKRRMMRGRLGRGRRRRDALAARLPAALRVRDRSATGCCATRRRSCTWSRSPRTSPCSATARSTRSPSRSSSRCCSPRRSPAPLPLRAAAARPLLRAVTASIAAGLWDRIRARDARAPGRRRRARGERGRRWLPPRRSTCAIAVRSRLLVASPLLLALAAIAIKLDSRGPVLYRRAAVGRDGGRVRAAASCARCTRAPTRSGSARRCSRATRGSPGSARFLRRFSLDELPNLVNVLRGEMAIVGPRPTIAAQVERLHAAPAPPARGQARAHRLGAGQRPRRDPLGGADRARRLVRRPPLAGARPAHPRPHRPAAAHRPRPLRVASARTMPPRPTVDAARLPPRRRRGGPPLVQRRAGDRRPGRQPRRVHARGRRGLGRAGDGHLRATASGRSRSTATTSRSASSPCSASTASSAPSSRCWSATRRRGARASPARPSARPATAPFDELRRPPHPRRDPGHQRGGAEGRHLPRLPLRGRRCAAAIRRGDERDRQPGLGPARPRTSPGGTERRPRSCSPTAAPRRRATTSSARRAFLAAEGVTHTLRLEPTGRTALVPLIVREIEATGASTRSPPTAIPAARRSDRRRRRRPGRRSTGRRPGWSASSPASGSRPSPGSPARASARGSSSTTRRSTRRVRAAARRADPRQRARRLGGASRRRARQRRPPTATRSRAAYEQTMRRAGAARALLLRPRLLRRGARRSSAAGCVAARRDGRGRRRRDRRGQRRRPPLLPRRHRRRAPARLAVQERRRRDARPRRRARAAAQPRRRRRRRATASRSSSAASPTRELALPHPRARLRPGRLRAARRRPRRRRASSPPTGR